MASRDKTRYVIGQKSPINPVDDFSSSEALDARGSSSSPPPFNLQIFLGDYCMGSYVKKKPQFESNRVLNSYEFNLKMAQEIFGVTEPNKAQLTAVGLASQGFDKSLLKPEEPVTFANAAKANYRNLLAKEV